MKTINNIFLIAKRIKMFLYTFFKINKEKIKYYPDIVYKYRSWNDKYHKKMLSHNEVYLSSPNDFNDPFDCKITRNFLLLDTEKKINKYIEIFIKENRDHLIKEGYNIEDEKIRLKQRFNNIKDVQKEYEEIEDIYTNQFLGVFSLSSKWNSILMWSHYGNNHKGYCIGFDEKKLRNSNIFGSGGNVVYTDKIPQISPLDKNIVKNTFLQTHRKAKDWQYENEYRLTKLFFDKKSTQRTVILPTEFIKEVIVGINISKKDKEEIKEICKSKNITLYEAYKDKNIFNVKRKKIM